MKLFGRYHEMSLNQISLYRTPIGAIKDIMDKHPEMQITIKEYRPKENARDVIYQTEDWSTKVVTEIKEKLIYHPDYSKRHQVLLVEDLGFMKVTLYSEPMNYTDIEKNLKLKSIPAAKKKEKLEMAISKMDTNTAHERKFHVERITIPPVSAIKKSKKR
jgi:hypothetical protein